MANLVERENDLIVLDDAEALLFSKDITIDKSKQQFFKVLSEMFVQNAKFLKRLDHRLNYLVEGERRKNRVLLAYHVTRLKMIRQDTSYNMALSALIKTLKRNGGVVDITPETDKDVKKSFNEAIANVRETHAFKHRLRATEIAELVDYKSQ